MWTPDPFATTVERRPDGSLLLRPVRELGPIPRRLVDSLEHWARVAPDRLLVARRDGGGQWVRVTYAQMSTRVQRLAAGLLARRLSAERPILILSGNGIEHLALALAAMWVGIPYCPVSPSYSLASGDLARLGYALELLTPGLVATFDGARFADHARAHPASSRCVRRALFLPEAPSLDRGEITDKGSVNQPAVLRHHAAQVAELYLDPPPDHVAAID